MQTLKSYLVGGAVRDAMMGLKSKDRDFVVVNSCVQEMLSLGFKQVGKDFPVFLHPETKEEYALARLERKTGPGYRGFETFHGAEVTLEEDLYRRDLTINAMARAKNGTLIDPYGGAKDIKAKVLRAVNPKAFEQDPVRVLRLARFAARHSDFSIDPQTLEAAKACVDAQELTEVTAERIFLELSKGFMETKPSVMLQVLRMCGALKVILPEIDQLFGVPQNPTHHPEVDTGVHSLMALDYAAKINAPLNVRWAALLHDVGKGVTPSEMWPSHINHESLGVPIMKTIAERLKFSNDLKQLCVLVSKEHLHMHICTKMKATSLTKFLMRLDPIRHPERFEQFMQVCKCDARGRLGLENRPYPQIVYMQQALQAMKSVNVRDVIERCNQGSDMDRMQISVRVYNARVSAIKAFVQSKGVSSCLV